jgi:capsular exopolysaccharide synthesis family protein
MDIQKFDDNRDLSYPVQAPPQQMQMMAVPDVGGPGINPLMMIWRRKGVLVGVLIACVLAAGVRYLFSTQIYRSDARLFVQTGGSKAPLDVTTASNAGQSQGNLHTQCELIKSASILASVLASPELADLKTLDVPSRWTTLKDNLSATVGKDNDIITVSFESPYPKEAQTILKTVVDAYANYHSKEKRSRVAELEKWRNKTQLELERKQKELLEFKKANHAVSFAAGDKNNLTVQKLLSLQTALTEAHVETVNAKSAYESAKAKLADAAQLHNFIEYLRSTGVSIGADSNEQALRSQLLAMEAQSDELARRYLPNHPSVRASQATVATLRARIAEMDRSQAETYLLALEQKVSAAKNREAELQQSFEEQNRAAMALNDKAAEYEQIDADAKRLAGMVEKADLQIIDLNATENVGVPTVQVFDEPNLPNTPVKPDRSAMLVQGLLIGLVLGCFAALVRDWTDQGLRSSEEIIETMGVPLLGSVPHMAGPPNPMAQGRKVDFEPASDVAETYRTIRTAVFFGTPDRESRTILVTSPAPGDGKSTFASNLAIAMAQTGKRVLLVDADFRRPVQHRIFESRPGIGLSTVLAGHEPLDKTIQSTGIAGLDILPAGPQPSNPSEILNSQSFNEVLEELSVRYEHVVVDSPAVMAVADARILAAMCSVTILVLRAQTSTRKTAMHARRALQSVGAAILGVVVNDVPRARDRAGDYGSYSGYRAKYNGGSGQPLTPDQQSNPAAGHKSTAMVPARSFLDLRRK